jgi:uncharacterized repeat protein (TIGR01451 family)
MKRVSHHTARALLPCALSMFFCATGLAQNNLLPGTLDCASTRPAFSFDIAPAWTSARNLGHNCTTPLVGDIDGDGITEVLALNYNKSEISVMDGPTGASKGSIKFTSRLEDENPTCFLIVDGDGDGLAEVFIAGTYTQKVYLYEVNSAPGASTITFAGVWEKSFTQTGSGVTPVAADLDGDGRVEFVAGNRVIDYDGNIVATLPFNSILHYDISISCAADVDGDGLPEIICGSDVYKYANRKLTRYARCYSFSNGQDGWNMSGDIDMDGNVDLVFCSAAGNYTVWTPKTNTVIGNISVSASYSSYPFIGDIDGTVLAATGKKHPEICFITYRTNSDAYVYAYTYTATATATDTDANNAFQQKWRLSHSDLSGATGITLFDFNLDGVVELVYRDMSVLRIFDGSGTAPAVMESIACTSGTTTETPVIADVTGDGSADILVTGNPNCVFAFEGGTSKWASAPNVWNQQMYSPLFVNRDLTVPARIESQTLAFRQTCSGTPQTVYYYNGGPMQAPYIGDAAYCPIDLSPDVYVVSGTLTTLSTTSVRLDITFGNMGMALVPAGTPIRYYQYAIATDNAIGSGTLGTSLAPGQTCDVSLTLTVSSPMPDVFYVRILDDGTNFPAAGSFSDCNLTNNTKSFGTLELHKTVDASRSCTGDSSVVTVEVVNSSSLTSGNIVLTDSLGLGWEYLSASVTQGSPGSYDPANCRLQWTLPALAPGAKAQMTLTARSVNAGAIRNYAWIESTGGKTLSREMIEAYVSVAQRPATAPAISPASLMLCPGSSTTLTASAAGATAWQWYLNGTAIPGATQSAYNPASAGSYTVTYNSGGACASPMSDAATVSPCPILVNPHLRARVY